jgi:hypothetical protein
MYTLKQSSNALCMIGLRMQAACFNVAFFAIFTRMSCASIKSYVE